MKPRTAITLAAVIAATAAITGAFLFTQPPEPQPAAAPAKTKDEIAREHTRQLVAKYKDYRLVDAHNHDAWRYTASLGLWGQYAVNKVVLFGAVSDPSAVPDDQSTWEAFTKYPDLIYPFFSGFDLHSEEGLDTVRANLEKGFYGIGEVAAASSYSKQLEHVKWKGKHALDGLLPQVYDIAAEYKAPILLHIDPFDSYQRKALEDALDHHPDTNIIYAHGNVSSTPEQLEELLTKHPNLYIDYFAGYTRYSGSPDYAKKFAAVMTRHPERFFLSTDSGAELNYSLCYAAIYELLDLLDEKTGRLVASGNMTRLLESQPPTQTQLQQIQTLTAQQGLSLKIPPLTKHTANELLLKLTKQEPNQKSTVL